MCRVKNELAKYSSHLPKICIVALLSLPVNAGARLAATVLPPAPEEGSRVAQAVTIDHAPKLFSTSNLEATAVGG